MTLHFVLQIRLNALAILMRRLRSAGSIGRGSKLKRRRRGTDDAGAEAPSGVWLMCCFPCPVAVSPW
jgi:hypothetical protein